MLSLESQSVFLKFAFALFCYITNYFVSGNIKILGKQNL